MELAEIEEVLLKAVQNAISSIKSKVEGSYFTKDYVKQHLLSFSQQFELSLQKLQAQLVFSSLGQLESIYLEEKKKYQKELNQMIQKLPKKVQEVIAGKPNHFFENVELENFDSPVLKPLKFENCEGLFQLQDGKRNGRGIEFFSSGAFFEGYFLNDKACGMGFYVSPNGLIHKGGNFDNAYFGYGEWPLSERYAGEHVNSQAQGFGRKEFKNGEIYLGFWKENKRFGYGEIYDKGKKLLSKSIYRNDQVVKQL